jgi:hypothetical protein
MPSLAQLLSGGDVNQALPEAYQDPNQGLAPILQHLGSSIGKVFMAPGQALQSTTPMTSEDMIKPAADLAMMTTLGAGAVPQDANALNMGIKAYHGSPHDFDAFDLSKIGTGEGAQAYGHGLYFAGNEDVAKSYRDIQPVPASIEELAMQGGPPSRGHMYEVNINADPEHFLDWDKPLSEQSPQVQQAAKQAMGANWNEFKSAKAGDAIKQGFVAPGADTTAAQLHQAGIPGIKYLDQGSRAAGDGSRNYVVFNDKLIDILKKYGMVGAIPAAGAGFGGLAQQAQPST